MDTKNIPLQVIAHCDAGGTLQPLRFRYEDAQHRVHTVRVEQVTDSRRLEFVGIDMLSYLCKTTEEGKEHLYELRYTVPTHRWVLFRQIY